MRSLLLTGLILFFGINLSHGQIKWSDNGLEVDNHEEVQVIIENLSPAALNIGLTKDRIESRVNIRLRQVNLRPVTDSDRLSHLYINFTVIDQSYNIQLNFVRVVSYNAGDVEYYTPASVYSRLFSGIYPQNSEDIISGLDQLLDVFISAYLNAND